MLCQTMQWKENTNGINERDSLINQNLSDENY